MSKKYTILFVCTGNTCRSPMAEGALRVLLDKERPGRAVVKSAGISAASGFPATMYGAEAAKMWDVDLSAHQSQALTKTLIEGADLILGMSPEHVREILRIVPGAKDKTYLLAPEKLSPDITTGIAVFSTKTPGRSSSVITPSISSITARSIIFSSWRTLPGQL